jgi:hypothetical protein
MIRRLSLVGVLVALGAALALPLPTAAANPYQVQVLVNACPDTGGAHNLGYLELKVKAREVGTSGVNYFLVKSRQQWSSGIGWSTRFKFPNEKSKIFPNDSSNYYHVTDRRYDYKPSDEIINRLQITVEFWSNSHGLLATRTVNGC